jgi:hypothetical protein
LGEAGRQKDREMDTQTEKKNKRMDGQVDRQTGGKVGI